MHWIGFCIWEGFRGCHFVRWAPCFLTPRGHGATKICPSGSEGTDVATSENLWIDLCISEEFRGGHFVRWAPCFLTPRGHRATKICPLGSEGTDFAISDSFDFCGSGVIDFLAIF